MDEAKLAQAWEIFDKAAGLEDRICKDPSKSDSIKATARRNADKKLAEAADLEAEALAS